jgi:hypothetical protein
VEAVSFDGAGVVIAVALGIAVAAWGDPVGEAPSRPPRSGALPGVATMTYMRIPTIPTNSTATAPRPRMPRDETSAVTGDGAADNALPRWAKGASAVVGGLDASPAALRR